MISFIVIGRNEGWKLEKCFSSIRRLIKDNLLQKYEIIYVDSDSIDNSIEIAKANSIDKIFQIKGKINAAIARNVGANVANGDILFFMDGDIEIQTFDLKCIIDHEQLIHEYVVGFLDDVNYSNDWKFINQTERHSRKRSIDEKVSTVGGGIFIIPKETWVQFGGMDQKLKRTQDRDLSLRLAKTGIFGIRKAEIFGLHHTIPYNDKKRSWKMLFGGLISYKGIMIRKHLFNSSFLNKLLREEWTLIIFVISLLLLFIIPLFFLFYPCAVFIKTRKTKGTLFIQSFLFRFIQDIVVLGSILFFYPTNPTFQMVQLK